MGKSFIPMVGVLVAMAAHPLWCWLLVTKDHANLGIAGTGIANCITYAMGLLINLIYSQLNEEVS